MEKIRAFSTGSFSAVYKKYLLLSTRYFSVVFKKITPL